MPKKLEDLKKAIKAQLKKDNPDLSEEELENRAWSIAQSQYKKMKGKENLKIDSETGMIIVGENIKLNLSSTITPSSEIVEYGEEN
jgi:hypothetical protein